MEVLVLGDDDAMRTAVEQCTSAATAGSCLLVAGADVSIIRLGENVVGWSDGEPIAWRRGDVRGMISGPYARRGWASRCIDPTTGLWETYRLGRRAARRARGRARAARRLARRGGISMGPSTDHPLGG